MTNASLQLGTLSLLILLSLFGVLSYLVVEQPESLRYSRNGVPFYTSLIEHPETGPLIYPGAPFKMSETPWQAERAPFLGEHNDHKDDFVL